MKQLHFSERSTELTKVSAYSTVFNYENLSEITVTVSGLCDTLLTQRTDSAWRRRKEKWARQICSTFHHLNAYNRPFTKSRLIFQGAVYMEGGRSYNQDQGDPRRWIILAPYVFCIGFTYKGD